MIEVIVPQMGANIDKGKILRWYKKPGERVEDLEPLFELETSKAVFDVQADRPGVLTDIAHAAGVFPSGTVVGHIEADW
jgi:pyruvate/2-oxoglutarate dehydrogenase complex dihydrolipoamide acyltransferase (E2) component